MLILSYRLSFTYCRNRNAALSVCYKRKDTLMYIYIVQEWPCADSVIQTVLHVLPELNADLSVCSKGKKL